MAILVLKSKNVFFLLLKIVALVSKAAMNAECSLWHVLTLHKSSTQVLLRSTQVLLRSRQVLLRSIDSGLSSLDPIFDAEFENLTFCELYSLF
jgi:hypothetical protein